MKSKISLYIGVGLLLFGSACKKALDLKQQGVYTSDNYFRNETDAVTAVSGIYSLLEEEDYIGHAECTFDTPSDDYWRSGDHGEDEAIENLTYDASNAAIRYPYKWRYEEINRSTNCIINIPKITAISADVKNRSMGEAYFLRAFGYWRMMLIHGDAPIITEDDYAKQLFNVPKSPIEEVRKQIESDLLKAVDLLPESYLSTGPDRGRVSKGTALGLLTKLYMYWEKLPQAIATGQKVISNPAYALAANYADNFTRANENSTELLFSIQALQSVVQNDFTVYYIPRSWQGYGFSQPLQGLANEFEANDTRKAATLLSVGDKVDLGDGKGLTTFTADLSATGFAFKKYAVFNTTAAGGGVDHSFAVPLMRSADIYLLVAEALIRTQGAGAGDALINQIRHRASPLLKPVVGAGMTQLIHERRVELAGEGERHQDLMRWDKDKIVDIAAIYALPVSKAPIDQSKTVTFQRPKNYYFPLPQVEIDKSKGVLVQNPNF
ncbi:RagB/SusD family nutrient uptake outer membrane protein [Mucilaginibacter dorajii]|uniref:RagB/SusD family nutrient uptake outer membrane protein n=1 Tax=Mucilaginibacter dorajii TaxID=692994 RepID=A0ABP7QHP6_9SPHI|nr:RagB/SusD family nutrient uptake outer membrane protein [Mucilaginibacter dorajii]MCS3734288.1 hypothetical protein [Mucilaginibacter dorajii]